MLKNLWCWTLLCLILAAAAPPAAAMTAQLSEGEEDDERNFNYLILEETIEPGDGDAVQALLEAQFNRRRRTAIVLTSPGGALEAVDSLAQAILQG